MEDSKWEKFAALGGVAFVVLNVVGAVGTGSPPDPGKPDQVAKWFNDHAGAIKLSQFLGVLSVIALLWWFGSLWRKMAIAEGGRYRLSILAALGLVFSGTMLMAANATLSATALRVDDLQSGATIFYTLSNVLLASAGAGIVTFLTATSVLTLRAKMLPSWMGYLGLPSRPSSSSRRSARPTTRPRSCSSGSSASSPGPSGRSASASNCGSTPRAQRPARPAPRTRPQPRAPNSADHTRSGSRTWRYIPRSTARTGISQ